MQATRKGLTGIAIPPVTHQLPTLAELTKTDGNVPANSGDASESQSESEPDSPAPRDMKKYLGILEEARGDFAQRASALLSF